MADKTRILFLCTGNSCRSQMAEAWTNHLKGSEIKAYSAGVSAKGVDPMAHYRRVRDEIRAFVGTLPEGLMEP